MTYKSWPTADQQQQEQGRTDVVGNYILNPATGQPYDSAAPMPVGATVTPSANQRVNAQSGDFVAGSIVDLATLAAIVSGAKAAIKAAAGDITDLATIAAAISAGKMLTTETNSAGIKTDLDKLVFDSTDRLKTSLYGKGTVAGDTPFVLDTVTGGLSVAQFVQQQILKGNGYRATTGLVATSGGNAYVGMQAILNNSAKNILIYNILAFSGSGAASTDTRLYTNNASTADAALTTNLLTSIKNQQPASANTSSMSALWGSPASTTQTGSFTGTLVEQVGVPASNTVNMLQNGTVQWFKTGDVASVTAYVRVTTSANQAAVTLEWVEF